MEILCSNFNVHSRFNGIYKPTDVPTSVPYSLTPFLCIDIHATSILDRSSFSLLYSISFLYFSNICKQYNNIYPRISVLLNLICGSLTQCAIDTTRLFLVSIISNILSAYSFSALISFFECLECRSPFRFFVIISLSLSLDLTNTILMIPSSTYSFTYFVRISMCFDLHTLQ